jgi:flagellar biosynthetic protein FlhB
LDPIAGIKRMFSLNSLVELGKGIAKVSLIIAIACVLLMSMKGELLGLSREPLEAAIVHSTSLSLWAAIFLSSATVIIAMVDVPFQMFQHKKKLRMSRQDIKDELKDTEGKPEVKSKVRQMQMQMAQNRMMAEVPDADVVITNPTHYSVALKYNPESSGAPILVAKGADHIALKIREIAKANDVEFVESPALARSIFYTTELEQEVPEGLYVAVAQVLAYVFQLRQFRQGHGKRPYYVANPNIPPDLRH